MKLNNEKYRIVPLMIICMMSLSAVSQTVGDTIGTVKDARNVIITKSEEKTKIYAEYVGDDGKESFFYYAIDHISRGEGCEEYDDSWSFSFPYHRIAGLSDSEKQVLINNRKKVRHIVIAADHIYAGWRLNYNDKEGIKNCFEAGIRNVIGLGWQRGLSGPLFSIGVGFGMNRYNSQHGFMFVKNNDELLLERIAGGKEKRKSYMDFYTIHVPLIYKQPVGRYASFSLGTTLNFNFYVSAVSETKIESAIETIKFKGMQQRLFSPDIFVSFNIFGVGIYSTWTPSSLFQSGFGPSVKGWTIGVDIISM